MNDFRYCQPNSGQGSCSACCGLYNWVGCSRALVGDWLERQTEYLLKAEPSEKNLIRIKEELGKKKPEPLYPVIYNCEFLGFINRNPRRVGCLLHPSLNSDKNLRELSFYGRETCDSATCTAYIYLNDQEAELIGRAIDEWYLYGLCLTDLDLVKEFFRLASERIFQSVHPEEIMKRSELLEVFREYLELKEHWRYARNPRRFGKFYFVDGRYLIYRIEYEKLGTRVSRYDKIFNSLGSEFINRKEIIEAEEILARIFQKFAERF